MGNKLSSLHLYAKAGLDALFKSAEEPQNQTRSSKKKDLFSHSKLPDQLADQSENKFPQKGSNSRQTRNSSPQKIVTLDGKETSIDEPNPTISPANRSKLIKDNSEEADKVTEVENQKKNKSSKQNTNNYVSSADTPKENKKRIPFDAVEAVSFHDQTKGVEGRSDIASEPVQVTSSLDLYHTECISENESDTGKTVTPREENSIKNHIGATVVTPKYKKAEEKEENLNHDEPDVTKKHARAPGKQQTKSNSVGVLVEQIKSPIKQQNEKDSKKASQAKIQKKVSPDIKVIENLEKSSKDSQMNVMEANNGVLVELIQVEKDQPTFQSRKASYEPLKFRKQGGDKAIQMETATEIEPENDASQTSPSNTRLQNQQDENTMGKDKTLTVCKKQLPRKSSSKGIPMHTKDMKNGDKHKNQLDVVDRENKVLDSDIESFATADNAEITVVDSEEDASFITCEDEFDRHLLEKLETSNNKSGTGSDLETQNNCMKDFRRKNANNLNHGSNEQTGNDSNSDKGKSYIKRKSDSMEQLESSDEESVKINKWRKFAPSKKKKIADAFMSEDSSEPAESETADDHNSKDAKSSNIKSRKPQRGKSGGGQNRFVDYSSMDSEIVEDSVEEEVAQEVTASRPGRGKKSSAQNPPPYLEQILDTDVESQTEELTQKPAAAHTAEIYNFEEDDKNAAQVEEVHQFLQRTAEKFSLEKWEVFEILLSCNGDTRRALNWILFGNDSVYLSPWRQSDDQKLMEGEDIVRLKLVYGEEEVKERALFLEIMDRN
ncbi:hypothetical protein CHS0354_026341 [Potamilus streckersoni]|uniref:Uncharacterized protein n=1 Tax=Potamilus streckersoni TaxID=2493646 RepID=A0AAE0W5Z8_9BIVA|nr:hypothetical protein CHS0354_026341 [Potamilus streckersoni]